ncbi:MAG: cytochrome c oxidase subunit 3 [Microthrixaceae bacterium]
MTVLPAEVAPGALPRRRQLLFGTAFAAAAAAMFELALVGMYLSERGANRGVWFKEITVPLTQPNMQLGTLLFGSLFIQWAVWAIARNHRSQAYVGLALTLLMGLAFLNQTTFLWQMVKLPLARVEGPTFYAVTGGHFALVLAAMILIALMAIRAVGGQFSSRLPDGISAAAMFWHVTVALYAVLWLAVYVMK